MGSLPWQVLHNLLPGVTLLTGVLPEDAVLRRAQVAAEASADWPMAPPGHATKWTDGSATDPADPLLRRAAWAGVWREGDGEFRAVTGVPPGAQTSGRAEIAAIIWGLRGQLPGGEVVSDCQGAVTDDAARLLAGGGADLLNGADGDLWRLFVAAPGRVRWTPAHLSWPQARAAGVARADWLGNQHADKAANWAAKQRAVPADTRAKRQATLAALAAAQRTIAVVAEAALEAAPERLNRRARKAKRRKANRRLFARIFRPKRRAPARPARPAEAPEDQGGEAAHDLVHDIVVAAGPPPLAAQGRVGLRWTARCTRCEKEWTHTSRWKLAAQELCPATAPAQHRLEPRAHNIAKVGQHWRCTRCHLWVRSCHRAAQARNGCPLLALVSADGVEDGTAATAMRGLTRTCCSWITRATGRATGPMGLRPPGEAGAAPRPGGGGGPPLGQAGAAAAPRGPRPLALAWLPHMAVAHNGRATAACLRCGALAPREDPGRLRGTSCGGEVAQLPGRALRELSAGTFDEALWAAPEMVRQRARVLGWRPLGEAPGWQGEVAHGAIRPPPAPPPAPRPRPGGGPLRQHERRARGGEGDSEGGGLARGGIIAALFGRHPAGQPAREPAPRGAG